MPRHERTLSEWATKPPTGAPIRELLSLAEHFELRIDNPKGGSHYLLIDERLSEFQYSEHSRGCGNLDVRNNRYSIPTCHGKKVKGRYLKTVAKFIQFLSET